MNFYMSVITDQLASHKGPDAQIVKINEESKNVSIISMDTHRLFTDTIHGAEFGRLFLGSLGIYGIRVDN